MKAYTYDSHDWVLTQGDTYWKANPTLTMDKQINGNTCVTSIMEYANHEFGGNKNEGEFILKYLQSYGGMVIMNGVSINDISSFVNDFFKTTSFTSFKESIDSGNPVMTAFVANVSATEITGHNVMVIGYNSSNDLIYMDPLIGSTQIAPSSKFSLYQIPLTGIK